MELQKILVALDYGEAATQVLVAAITLAKGQHAELVLLSADLDVDAIVMVRRGRTGLTEAELGSASNHVLHRSHRPVFVVQ